MPQVTHHHPSILIHAFRTGVERLKVYALGEKSCRDEGGPLYGGPEHTTVSVKIVGTLLCLLVPAMLVYRTPQNQDD